VQIGAFWEVFVYPSYGTKVLLNVFEDVMLGQDWVTLTVVGHWLDESFIDELVWIGGMWILLPPFLFVLYY